MLCELRLGCHGGWGKWGAGAAFGNDAELLNFILILFLHIFYYFISIYLSFIYILLLILHLLHDFSVFTLRALSKLPYKIIILSSGPKLQSGPFSNRKAK